MTRLDTLLILLGLVCATGDTTTAHLLALLFISVGVLLMKSYPEKDDD